MKTIHSIPSLQCIILSHKYTIPRAQIYPSTAHTNYIFICPIAIAYSMGQIIKSVCVCVSVCVSVRLWALSRSHFLIDFHQNWHRRRNPEK